MKRIHLLTGNAEGRLSDLIEGIVKEICANHAKLECARTARVDEFITLGCKEENELLILIPHNLLPDLCEPSMLTDVGEAVRAIRMIKSQRAVPIVALVLENQKSQCEPLFTEAGADCVLGIPFSAEELKAAVGGLLGPRLEASEAPRKGWFRRY